VRDTFEAHTINPKFSEFENVVLAGAPA
jgi:hypothetical protein